MARQPCLHNAAERWFIFAAPLYCFPPGRCRQIAILPDEFLSDARHTLNFARTRPNRSMSNLISNFFRLGHNSSSFSAAQSIQGLTQFYFHVCAACCSTLYKLENRRLPIRFKGNQVSPQDDWPTGHSDRTGLYSAANQPAFIALTAIP